MTGDRDFKNDSQPDISKFQKKIEADFNPIHHKLKRIEKKYNPNDDNLHFDCLQKPDVDLFRKLLSLAGAGLKKVEHYHDFFSSESLYADGMFWYFLFLMISAASRGVMDKEAKNKIPKELIYDLTDILIEISRYSQANPGDITIRNHEALGNTVLAFYSEDLIEFVLKKKNAIDSNAVKDFICWTLRRVEEVKNEQDAIMAKFSEHVFEKSLGVRNMDNIPHPFRGYAGDPESELDVAFLLGLVLDHLPFRLVVSSINDGFPDCEGFDPVTGAPIRIELEVLSRNYLQHRHPMEGCDYIVCWRDNWPESKIKVISLEDIIYKNNLDGKHFIFIPKPGSLREQLYDLKGRDAEVYRVVHYFLNDVLEKIFQKYKGTRIDDRLTKHFSVRAANGKGVFGIYPHGKLVCLKVNEFTKRFGDDIAEPAKVFRETILGIKILRSTKDADLAGEALDVFLNAISKEK